MSRLLLPENQDFLLLIMVLGGCFLVLVVLLVVILCKLPGKDSQEEQEGLLGRILELQIHDNIKAAIVQVNKFLQDSLQSANRNTMDILDVLGDNLQRNQERAAHVQEGKIRDLQQSMREQTELLQREMLRQISIFQHNVQGQMESLEKVNRQKLDDMAKGLAENMRLLREENQRQLEEIRGTVNEKLQSTLEKRIKESFEAVSRQLQNVYEGLGEMKNLAQDVGGLKKVLSGVKTRGNLGEYQLAAILQQILAPELYAVNVPTKPGSAERVEFAIKLPKDGEGSIYLPIDSKFPGETYAKLKDAQDRGDRQQVEIAYKELERVIRSEAKDIHDKYLAVPYTTNFGIMFLPAEGLYAEVVGRGMVESLQRDYQVNIAGPSTMAALLNSLQMGFKTLAIQKRSYEAWEVLGQVQTEFGKFAEVLETMQKHLNSTSADLDTLLNTRTRQMLRKMQDIERLKEVPDGNFLSAGSKA